MKKIHTLCLEARLRDMTYGFTVHYDIEIDFVIKNEAGRIC